LPQRIYLLCSGTNWAFLWQAGQKSSPSLIHRETCDISTGEMVVGIALAAPHIALAAPIHSNDNNNKKKQQR
jgi:hypothetical protein